MPYCYIYGGDYFARDYNLTDEIKEYVHLRQRLLRNLPDRSDAKGTLTTTDNSQRDNSYYGRYVRFPQSYSF